MAKKPFDLRGVKSRLVERIKAKPADLLDHPGQAWEHPEQQAGALAGILRELGQVDTLKAYRSERAGGKLVCIDGHLRRSLDPDLMWDVDVLDLTDAEADYMLATFDPVGSMKVAEKAALDALLSGINSGEAAVQEMLAEEAKKAGLYADRDSSIDAPEPQIDNADELRQKWGVETHQIWQLGDHRLVCGDSNRGAVVNATRDGIEAKTLVFDPEWDAMPSAMRDFSSVLAFCDGATLGEIVSRYGPPTWVFAWDCVSCWYTPNRPLRRMKLCAWYGDVAQYQFDGWHYGDAGKEREVWNTRGEYHFQPDPRGKHLADVFSDPITQLHAESLHSHSKPVDWVTLLIANCTRGDVYDPFAGSGTTIIACERLGRRCGATELSPGYCAVTLERWAQMTGKTPELAGTCKPI